MSGEPLLEFLDSVCPLAPIRQLDGDFVFFSLHGKTQKSILPGCFRVLFPLPIVEPSELCLVKCAHITSCFTAVKHMAASLAVEQDETILEFEVGFGILAFLTKDIAVDEAIKMVLELGSFVSAVDDPAIIAGVGIGENLDNLQECLPIRQRPPLERCYSHGTIILDSFDV